LDGYLFELAVPWQVTVLLETFPDNLGI
jgi:hypothetical protein